MKTKAILVTSFLILSTSRVLAQTDSLYHLVEKEVCDCISEGDAMKTTLKDFRECMQISMTRNMNLLAAAAGITGDDSVSYKKGVEYGRKFGSTLDTGLVNACDAYFHIVDYTRVHQFDKLSQDSLKNRLSILAATNKQKSKSYDYDLSVVHFLLKNYETAASFADKTLISKPENEVSLIIKGFYFESVRNYMEAAKIYRHLAQSTKQASYWVWAVIVERKQREANKS